MAAAVARQGGRGKVSVLRASGRVRRDGGLCSRVVRAFALVVALSMLPAVGASGAGEVPEQRVTPIPPRAEQRVEPVGRGGEQRVEALDAKGVQAVVGGHKSPARRGAEAAGKVVLGVVAGVVSIGVMLASLLLL